MSKPDDPHNPSGVRSPVPHGRHGAHARENLLAERFQSLVESSDDWLWEIDADNLFTYCAPQVFNILGYEPGKLLGRPFHSVIPQKEVSRVQGVFEQYRALKKPFRLLECTAMSRDGRTVHLETNAKPFYDNNGRYQGYRGITRDVTERINLENYSRYLNDLLEQIAEPALVADTDLNITYLNQAFCQLFDYTSDEVIGRPVSLLGKADNTEGPRPDDVIEHLKKDGYWEGEVERRKKDGSSIPVLLKARATHDSDGNFLGYIGTYFDLSAYRAARDLLRQTLSGTIDAIASMVEKRDPYTFGHQVQVSELAVAIARELGKDEEFISGLRLGAKIHDIGKIYIPTEILNRPGPLSEHEFGIIKTHPGVGYDIIQHVNFPWPVADMVLQHHERLDGSGYPQGLRGDEILPEAKIIAVADVLQAITSHRPYRPAQSLEKGLQVLEKYKNVLYDPEIVNICTRVCREGKVQFSSNPAFEYPAGNEGEDEAGGPGRWDERE